jgi:hypothetical protein
VGRGVEDDDDDEDVVDLVCLESCAEEKSRSFDVISLSSRRAKEENMRRSMKTRTLNSQTAGWKEKKTKKNLLREEAAITMAER